MSDTLLRLANIQKTFSGIHALQDVSLTLERGTVHCLVGENGCGKSTLIKIVAGVYERDSGSVEIGGRAYQRLTPIDAIREGIQVIYQDFSLFPNLTVAENIALNEALASGRSWVNWGEVQRTAREALAQINVELPLDARVEELSVANRQLIAISKALRQKAQLIIMDEPTSALTEREIRTLFGVVRGLLGRGIAFLFVSHKLNEVLEIAEQITVMRNGQVVSSGPVAGYDQARLILEMTGRPIGAKAYRFTPDRSAPPLLRVRNLNVDQMLAQIDLDVYAGEIVGVAGLLGSGRTELAMALFGMLPIRSGEVSMNGKPIALNSIQAAVGHGIGYVPEDRLTEGLFLEQSIGNNIVVRVAGQLRDGMGLVSPRRIVETAGEWIAALRVKAADPNLPVRTLSGGNQQRVVVSKWLASQPKLLILNGPTVGVDIGSKDDLHETMKRLAGEGMGLLVISDDIPELLQSCNRLLLMRKGRIVEELLTEKTHENELAAKLIEA
jgi:simple sugar transport system ATP-binding protein